MDDNLPTDPPTPPRPTRWRRSRNKPQVDQSGQPVTKATGTTELEPRCEAAHPDDRSPCTGSVYSVEVIDRFGHPAYGCLWHGTVHFASLSQGLMYPAREDPVAVSVLRSIAPRLRGIYYGFLHHDPDARSER